MQHVIFRLLSHEMTVIRFPNDIQMTDIVQVMKRRDPPYQAAILMNKEEQPCESNIDLVKFENKVKQHIHCRVSITKSSCIKHTDYVLKTTYATL